MRVKSSLLNIAAGLGNQLIITILSFVSRTVFIHSLGVEYLGINALFTSILAMLSLAEAGIGSSIIYNLYKPVADHDQPKIMALMNLYKKAYMIIAAIVMLIGLALFPFLDFFVKETSVEQIGFIYLLFLVNTAAPYLFVYKHSFLNVNQKNYIVTVVFSISSIISTIIKIGILYFTENYMLYLAVESAIAIATSILLAHIVDRMYPFLKQKVISKLDPEVKASFVKNMKAIMLQNIGNYFIFGVDSILISSFISIAAVGLYSNYKMLIDICRTFVNQVFTNLYHSVGNLVASEAAETIYGIYKITMLINFWLYSLLSILLYVFVEPFIKLWLGSSFLMDEMVLLLLVLIFYERGMRNSITTVKTTAGIFHEDRYAPLCQALINLLLSLVLVQYVGLIGIFIGTLLSSLAVPFWLTPKLVYNKVFGQPLARYYKTYGYYGAIGLLAYAAASFSIKLLPTASLGWLLAKGMLCFTVVNLLYAALFYRTEEFNYLVRIAAGLIQKIRDALSIIRKKGGAERELGIGGNK